MHFETCSSWIFFLIICLSELNKFNVFCTDCVRGCLASLLHCVSILKCEVKDYVHWNADVSESARWCHVDGLPLVLVLPLWHLSSVFRGWGGNVTGINNIWKLHSFALITVDPEHCQIRSNNQRWLLKKTQPQERNLKWKEHLTCRHSCLRFYWAMFVSWYS